MIDVASFCEPDETIAGLEHSSPGYDIYMVAKPGRGEHDRVLLDIRETPTEPCILIGGNPFTIETMHGVGSMALVDVVKGVRLDIDLEPGVSVVDIAPGFVYSYENLGGEGSQLILRDTAKDFDLANEVTAEDMVKAIMGLFHPTKSMQ